MTNKTKITLDIPKPRAKHINDVLRSKRNEPHKSKKKKSRQELKNQTKQQLKDIF